MAGISFQDAYNSAREHGWLLCFDCRRCIWMIARFASPEDNFLCFAPLAMNRSEITKRFLKECQKRNLDGWKYLAFDAPYRHLEL